MKKLLSLVFCGLLLFGCSDKYDDSALRNDLNDLENRVAKLEELCKQIIELTKRYEKEYLTKKE